jgi:hypothetical protein
MLVGLAGIRGAGAGTIMLAERMARFGGWPVRMLIKHGLVQIGATSEEMYSVARLPIAAFIIFLMPNSQQIMGKFEPALGFSEEPAVRSFRWNPTFGWAAALGIGMFGCLGMLGNAHRFLYFQF